MREPAWVRAALASFKVWPESKRKHFFQVLVYRTVAEMREAIRGFDPDSSARSVRGAWGQCSGFTITRAGKIQNHIGFIFLTQSRLGVGIVSHECLHAVLHWARVLQINPEIGGTDRWVSPNEERLCYALTELTRQTYNALYDQEILRGGAEPVNHGSSVQAK